jgi:hypothetical protein
VKTNPSANNTGPASLDDVLVILQDATEALRSLSASVLQGKGPDGRKLDREATCAVVGVAVAARALLSPENYASLLQAIRQGRLPRKERLPARIHLKLVEE